MGELENSFQDLESSIDDIETREWGDTLGNLPSGDKEPFQQKTFTLHDSQVETVENAVKLANKKNDSTESENQNSNGNGLYYIALYYLENNE
jgi:hypothetical protein